MPHASPAPRPPIDRAVPAIDQMRTGRRPTRSDRRPQNGTKSELHQRVDGAEERRHERADAERVVRLLCQKRQDEPEAEQVEEDREEDAAEPRRGFHWRARTIAVGAAVALARTAGRARRPPGCPSGPGSTLSLWARTLEARRRDGPRRAGDRRGAGGFVADDAARARRLLAADLELGLDQRDQSSASRGCKRGHGGHELVEADERGVDDREVDRAADGVRRQRARVGALHHDDARVDRGACGRAGRSRRRRR